MSEFITKNDVWGLDKQLKRFGEETLTGCFITKLIGEVLQKEIGKIRAALDHAQIGSWEPLGELKIPARFFKEDVLRKHGKSLLSGNQEVRYMDLYVRDSSED